MSGLEMSFFGHGGEVPLGAGEVSSHWVQFNLSIQFNSIQSRSLFSNREYLELHGKVFSSVAVSAHLEPIRSNQRTVLGVLTA